MPKKLQKSLQEYISKIKSPTPSNNNNINPFPSPTKWILSGCKEPKTPSFAFHRGQNQNHSGDQDGGHTIEGTAATLSDVDRFLLENFKSLYITNDEEDICQNKNVKEKQATGPCGGDESPRFFDLPPDLCGSHRFFVAAGSSSSLVEEARLSTTTTTATEEGTLSSTSTSNTLNESTPSSNNNNYYINDIKKKDNVVSLPDDCIAVVKYSPSPNDDFRRSMQEMVEARLKQDETVDWDFMQELLFCYLNLNEKKSHKFILSAFVDLIVGLRQRSSKVSKRPRRSSIVARERRRKLRNVT